MKRNLCVLLFAAAALLVMPIASLACACCAEPGLYFLRTEKPSSYAIDILKEFEFAEKASLYLTEADFEIIKGLDDIKPESASREFIESGGAFDLAGSFTGKLWRFEMRSPGGKRGVISLPIPAQMVTFKADIHDEENRPNGPLLYKEFRFKGSIVTGTGIFRSSRIRPTTYFLVFQGRGNGCDNVEDFTHWRLEVDGPRARYAFYGKLSGGESPE